MERRMIKCCALTIILRICIQWCPFNFLNSPHNIPCNIFMEKTAVGWHIVILFIIRQHVSWWSWSMVGRKICWNGRNWLTMFINKAMMYWFLIIAGKVIPSVYWTIAKKAIWMNFVFMSRTWQKLLKIWPHFIPIPTNIFWHTRSVR